MVPRRQGTIAEEEWLRKELTSTARKASRHDAAGVAADRRVRIEAVRRRAPLPSAAPATARDGTGSSLDSTSPADTPRAHSRTHKRLNQHINRPSRKRAPSRQTAASAAVRSAATTSVTSG